MANNASTDVRRSKRPRQLSKKAVEAQASAASRTAKRAKKVLPPPPHAPSPPPPLPETPPPGSPAAPAALMPVSSLRATPLSPTKDVNEPSVPPEVEPQTITSVPPSVVPQRIPERPLDLVVDEVSDDEEERRALANVVFDQPAQIVDSTTGDEPVPSPKDTRPKAKKRTTVKQGDAMFDLQERTRRILDDVQSPIRQPVQLPTNLISSLPPTLSPVVPIEDPTSESSQPTDNFTEDDRGLGNGDRGEDEDEDRGRGTPPVESDGSGSDYEGDAGESSESASEHEEAVGSGKKSKSRRKKKQTKKVASPPIAHLSDDVPDEETQPKKTSKAKGKARATDKSQTHTSPGPLSEAVKRKADEKLAIFLQAVDELAKESGHTPDTIHYYLGTKLSPTRDSNFWNIYEVWYRRMKSDDDVECQNAPREEWSSIISKWYKAFWAELGDLEHDKEARQAHMAPIIEWHTANFHNFVEKLGEDGKMVSVLHKMAKPFIDMSERSFRSCNAHIFGFVIHPEAKGYGGFMWGGSPDFLEIRDKKKSQINTAVKDFVMFFNQLDYDRRHGVNQPNVPYVPTVVPAEEKKTQRDIDRELLGNFLQADIATACNITTAAEIDKIRVHWGEGWGKFAYENHLTFVGWPRDASGQPGKEGSSIKSLDPEFLKSAVTARVQLQSGEQVTAKPLLRILPWQPDVIRFKLEQWAVIPIICGPQPQDVIMMVGEVKAYKIALKKEELKAAREAKKQAKAATKGKAVNRRLEPLDELDEDDDEERPITPPPRPRPRSHSNFQASTTHTHPRISSRPAEEPGQHRRDQSLPPPSNSPPLPFPSEAFGQSRFRQDEYPTTRSNSELRTTTHYNTSFHDVPPNASQSTKQSYYLENHPSSPSTCPSQAPNSQTRDFSRTNYDYQAHVQRNPPPTQHRQMPPHEANYSNHMYSSRPIHIQRDDRTEDRYGIQPPAKRQRHESIQPTDVNHFAHPPHSRQPVPHLDLNNMSKVNRYRGLTQTPRATPTPLAGPSRTPDYENRATNGRTGTSQPIQFYAWDIPTYSPLPLGHPNQFNSTLGTSQPIHLDPWDIPTNSHLPLGHPNPFTSTLGTSQPLHIYPWDIPTPSHLPLGDPNHLFLLLGHPNPFSYPNNHLSTVQSKSMAAK
ncbi:hypothetical protein BDN72DRAFT_905121 [Pluteus cervinus]|uniref:Uncharacterized protein n=1 Tax=Pluteus cervinus TaxID=181527 RepID=A0ACD3A3G6_9AGAR|nr:hypothetical protein BDN72DRAFT_905121 [Pluteus cervinus]